MTHRGDNNFIAAAINRCLCLTKTGQNEPGTSHSSALPDRVRGPRRHEHLFLVRLSKFFLVGGTGVLVNSFALLILFQWVQLPLVVASVLSTELAIINNFCWNNRWTFGCTQISLGRFAQFNLVSLGGLAINTFTLWLLVRQGDLPYLVANLIGIAMATTWNFAANSLWTWGGAM